MSEVIMRNRKNAKWSIGIDFAASNKDAVVISIFDAPTCTIVKLYNTDMEKFIDFLDEVKIEAQKALDFQREQNKEQILELVRKDQK